MIHGRLLAKNGECLVKNVAKTTNFFERFIGLLGTPSLAENKGLLICPCSSVHCIGMRYPIDLVFLDNEWQVVKTVSALKPWRFSSSSKASMVLEIAANQLDKINININDKLEWHNND